MIISTFKSIHRAYVDYEVDLPWQEMAELLSTHFPAEIKEDVPLYNLVKFKSINDETAEPGRKYQYINGEKTDKYDIISGTVRRCKNNVLELHGIVLDVDEDMTIADIQKYLDGVEYLLYTTFRHTKERNKFRVVIPFTQPLLADDIAGRQASIIDTFPGVDNASFTVSQGFYFHSGNDPDRKVIWNQGYMIDPYAFDYKEPETYAYDHNDKTFTEIDDEYKQAVILSLMTCNGLHYHSAKSRYGVLTLVSICRSLGLSFDDFDFICRHIADPASTLMNPTLRRNAWMGWDGNRVRRTTRNEFIQAHNGRLPQFKPRKDPELEKLKKRFEVKNG